MNNTLIQPEDYRFRVETPDSSFSPERNKALVQETLKEAEKFFKDISTALDAEAYNRMDMFGSYGVYRFNRGTKSFKEYLGHDLYKTLIGEKIMEKVRMMDTVNKLNGNTKYKNFIQL